MDKECADMARRSTKAKTTFGKAFRKKSSRGKFKKGTWIKYKYVNGRRVGSVKSRK
jgi:hypothetical protein